MKEMILLFIYPIFLSIVIYFLVKGFFLNIYSKYKIRTSATSMDEVLAILKTIIQTEIEMYEDNIFSKRKALDNVSYENYFRDITNNIIDSLSSDFFYKSSVYFTDETVIRIITRNVSKYLKEKIQELNMM